MRYRGAAIVLLAAFAIFVFAQRPRTDSLPGPAPVPKEGGITFLATFGYKREAPKVFDGSVRITGGTLRKLDSWRFFQNDAITGANTWKLQTKRVVFENQPDQPNPIGGPGPARNLVPAGIIVTSDASASGAEIETAQGRFSVPLRELAYGRILRFLNDDVIVQRVPESNQVSPEDGQQHDYPSVTVTRAGATWTAWQAYQDRGDNVYVRQNGEAPKRITEQKGDIYRTSIAEDSAGHIHVVWSERDGENWVLVERVYDGESWGGTRRPWASASPNIFHKLAASANGALKIVWVGHDSGESYLYLSAWNGTRWSEPQRISGPSVWMPDAVADRDGNLFVAWDSYQNGNYDIFFRRIAADGAPGPIEQVTKSPRFEAHASLAVDAQGRPWLAWDESGSNWGKDWNHEDPYRATVLYANRSIRVAVKDGGTWKDAPDFSSAVPDRLRRYAQLPHLAADGSGRIWALFQMRSSAQNNREDYWCSGGLWDLYLSTLEDGEWKPAAMVPQSTGRNEMAFQIVPAVDRISMVWAMDGRNFGRVQPGFGGTTMYHYNVFSASASAPGGQASVQLSPFTESLGGAQVMHSNEKADVARMRSYRASVGGTEYRILRGDFHRHTDISADGSGDGSLEDYYRYMIDVAAMDTGVVTDHNMGGDVEYSWWRTEKSEDVFRIHNRYLPLFGYERSVNYPNGHRNVVWDHRGIRTLPISAAENQAKVNSGPIVYPYVRQNRGICMEHSLATGQGTDYRDNDPELEPLVEIYQGYHAGYEYEGGPRAETGDRHVQIHGAYEPAGFWWNALAKGLRLGVQASSDHISTHCSYAMIYTPSVDRTQIVESMRKRHAYGATDNILLDFEAEGHLMGEEFSFAGTPKLTAKIEGTGTIAQIDLIRNNEYLYTQKPGNRAANFEYVDRAPRPGTNYYYVRVTQLDGNLAWSSPIWIRK